MEKPWSLASIDAQCWTSFGEKPNPLPLVDLNVLIGPNGSGKSNLLDALDFLRVSASAQKEWIRFENAPILWKGSATSRAILRVTFRSDPAGEYSRGFAQDGKLLLEGVVRFDHEVITQHGVSAPKLQRAADQVIAEGDVIKRTDHEFDPGQSIVAQLRDPFHYPTITRVGDTLRAIRLYRQWTFGPRCPLRGPQLEGEVPYVMEDCSNLAPVLRRQLESADFKKRFMEELREDHPDAEDLTVDESSSGYHSPLLSEHGYELPATMMSDGTLRWIFLLTILLDPSPPPVLCIEEPELGMHPDMIPTLARLLREASQRMQVVATTHSSALVDELTDIPEAVVVCERRDGATSLRRLERADLLDWLKEYQLGRLWARGTIGGNRW